MENLAVTEATLRLFKNYIISEDVVMSNVPQEKLQVLTASAHKGILYYGHNVSSRTIAISEKLYGKSGEDWNKTFHKSFATVRDLPIETLIAQQVIHYFTTYGLEPLGLYDSDLVYIPNEKLEIPELEEDIPMIVIKEITPKELEDKLMELLTCGIALSEQTIEDIETLVNFVPQNRIDEIKNREIKTFLYNYYEIMPSNGEEFIKYFIFKLTGKTMIVKNQELIKELSNIDAEKIYLLLTGYLVQNTFDTGYKELAKIFNRYKKVFIALKRADRRFKYNKELNAIINKISKLSKSEHKPMKKQILDTVSQVKYNEDELYSVLNKVSIYRVIRILNGLGYRLKVSSEETKDIMYRVRNGKSYVSTIRSSTDYEIIRNNYAIIKKYLKEKLESKLKGKSVYIPSNMNYVLPQSEKQFTNSIPEGSYISFPRTTNMVVGIHWNNLGHSRVDLDLHLQNKDTQIGWNTAYRGSDLYYSGDVVDGVRGATEVMFIGKGVTKAAYLLTMNVFTGQREVPYEFIVAESSDVSVGMNYTVDPNKIKLKLNLKTNELQNMLGTCVVLEDEIRFYFNDISMGNNIVSTQNKYSQGMQSYINTYRETQLGLKEILSEMDVKLLDKPFDEKLEEVVVNGETLYKKVETKADYDLSLESLTVNTFVSLLS